MKEEADPARQEQQATAQASLRWHAAKGSLPLAPALNDALKTVHIPVPSALVSSRIFFISALAIAIAAAAAVIAQLLTALIGFFTNLAFYGRISTAFISPAGNHLGGWVVLVPVAGGIVVGLMARFGSAAIRGHGIPEAMENVLTKGSRIPARLTVLKPLSAAIAMGTGGPFGAEGPIIATGGALGSLVGQLLHTTASERKTLLAAGAAAGMAAIFGSPLSAVILAIELLLFEFRPRSVIPVALASVTAIVVRGFFVRGGPVFPLMGITAPGGEAMAIYCLLGILIGFLAVGVTRLVYAVEDAFEHLPFHWMWWPALGGLAVGIVGYFAPRTLGVGYDNIEHLLTGAVVGRAALFLCVMKLISWSIALGSGTSGGTLAPLFTVGGAFGALAGGGLAALLPSAGIDPRIAALIGMAGIFAGASRALLASILFAVETTQQPLVVLPLLGGCTAAYLISCLIMRHTIMTEKISRRGIRVPSEFSSDWLEHVPVGEMATKVVVTLRVDQPLGEVRDWLASNRPEASHQGFPVVDVAGNLLGLVTRRDLLDTREKNGARVGRLIHRAPVVIHGDNSLSEARDQMVTAGVGRLPVVARDDSRKIVGIVTRGDLLAAYRRLMEENKARNRHLSLNRQIANPPNHVL